MLSVKVGMGYLNTLKKNADKEACVGVCVVDKVAYTFDFMNVGVLVLNRVGEAESPDGAFEIYKHDFANLRKGKGEVEFTYGDGEEGSYTANGYKYCAGADSKWCEDRIHAFVPFIKGGELVYKGKLPLPTRDRVVGLVGKNEPKESINHLVWNTRTGALYATNTKIMLKSQTLPVLGNDFCLDNIIIPLKLLNYLTDDEVEISQIKGEVGFINGDSNFVVIKQNSLIIIINTISNSTDKPPNYEGIIPYKRKVRGHLAVRCDYLLKLLKGFRYSGCLITLAEDGEVKLKDYDSDSSVGVDIPTDRDCILHNAPLEDGNNVVCYRVEHLTAICKYSLDDFIIIDIPAKEHYKNREGVDEYEYTFSQRAAVVRCGDDLIIMMCMCL